MKRDFVSANDRVLVVLDARGIVARINRRRPNSAMFYIYTLASCSRTNARACRQIDLNDPRPPIAPRSDKRDYLPRRSKSGNERRFRDRDDNWVLHREILDAVESLGILAIGCSRVYERRREKVRFRSSGRTVVRRASAGKWKRQMLANPVMTEILRVTLRSFLYSLTDARIDFSGARRPF